jgi:hypothetical protein
MDTHPLHALIEIMAKHLAPSGAELRYGDMNGMTGEHMRALRPDVVPVAIPDAGALAALPPGRLDSIGMIGTLNAALLRAALYALREGGRLIVVDPAGTADARAVAMLGVAGYNRILAEPVPGGALLRGEKPHASADTLARIRVAARADQPRDDLAGFRGRFVHVPVRQTPNKPVWALKPDDVLTWEGITVMREGAPALIAFSSLPNAVAFMQRAVLADAIVGVNKVAKFTRETAETWPVRVLLNPLMSDLPGEAFGTHALDPASAITGEE